METRAPDATGIRFQRPDGSGEHSADAAERGGVADAAERGGVLSEQMV